MSKTPLEMWKEKNPDKAEVIKKQQEDNIKTRPWHLLDPNKHLKENELFQIRYSICNSCPEFIKLTKQCRKCGCFMEQKAKLEAASCPLGKW